jgi:hypothetical protein
VVVGANNKSPADICSTRLVTLTDSVLAYIALPSVSLPMQLVVEFLPPVSRSTMCAHSIRLVKVDVRLTQYTQADELSQRRENEAEGVGLSNIP